MPAMVRTRLGPPAQARATQNEAGFAGTVLADMVDTLDRFTGDEIPVPDGSSAAELREFYAAWRSELTA